jgi:acetyl esterase
MSSYKLEKAALELTEKLAKAPPLAQVQLDDARKAVEAAQSTATPMPDIDESWTTVASDSGDVSVRLIRPPGVRGPFRFVCICTAVSPPRPCGSTAPSTIS